jgi:SAM-dependent methyltransferase
LSKISNLFKFNSKKTDLIQDFLDNGKIPWSKGYNKYKWKHISDSIRNTDLVKDIKNKNLPIGFGHRVDERVVEYPWIFSNLNSNKEIVLDAGSTFNFKPIVEHTVIEKKNLNIFTFSPEKNNFIEKGVSYIFGDLRILPFKDNWFDIVISQSTIEHIDMDNSIYGYDLEHNKDNSEKSYEYLLAIKEMIRVLKPKGTILLTVPYGKFENHGFFQQFDEEMLNRVNLLFKEKGDCTNTFFKYHNEGWKFSTMEELKDVESYNPHTGVGKKDDNAAHCRGVACMKFTKL